MAHCLGCTLRLLLIGIWICPALDALSLYYSCKMLQVFVFDLLVIITIDHRTLCSCPLRKANIDLIYL